MIPEHSPTPHAHHMLRHRIQAVTGDFCDEMLTLWCPNELSKKQMLQFPC